MWGGGGVVRCSDGRCGRCGGLGFVVCDSWFLFCCVPSLASIQPQCPPNTNSGVVSFAFLCFFSIFRVHPQGLVLTFKKTSSGEFRLEFGFEFAEGLGLG